MRCTVCSVCIPTWCVIILQITWKFSKKMKKKICKKMRQKWTLTPGLLIGIQFSQGYRLYRIEAILHANWPTDLDFNSNRKILRYSKKCDSKLQICLFRKWPETSLVSRFLPPGITSRVAAGLLCQLFLKIINMNWNIDSRKVIMILSLIF